MCAIDLTVLSTDPGIEEVARHVSTIGLRMTLVVSGIGQTFSGAEVGVESWARLILHSDVST